MIIKRSSQLAITPLRRDAIMVAEAGYQSLDIRSLFADNCTKLHNSICVDNQVYNLANYRHVYLVGIGKGSALAARSLVKSLPKNSITQGVVIDIRRRFIHRRIKSLIGTHPLPSEENIAGTNQIIDLLNCATAEDLVITVICGGGSSLGCQPSHGLTCTDLQQVSDHLLKSGATIEQINTVRKHISLIHGGNMAKYAYPATVLSLIISDVPGNDLQMVASGPTELDHTSEHDAQKIAKQFGLPNLEFVETPKDPRYFKKVTNIVLASGSNAVIAMQGKAIELGYTTAIYSQNLSGLANQVGPKMAEQVKPGQALLACGETQVIVTHPGKGGRNQDLALSALPHLHANSVMVSCASDGKDNIPVAGAITDSEFSRAQAKKFGVNPVESVKNNRSYATLKRLKGIFQIKPVTANVSDFIVVLRDKT